MAHALRLGDTRFLVASEWWEHVVVQGQSEDEGEQDARIRNEGLVDTSASTDEHCILKPGLVEGRDYRVVSEDVWRAFAFEFGYDWEVLRVVTTASKAGTPGLGSSAPVLDVYPTKPDNRGRQERAFDSNSASSEDKESSDMDEMDRWRATLEEDQLVDMLDTDMKWCKTRIVVLDDVRVKVCYVGWSPDKEEWLTRLSPRLMPLYSNVERWRDFQANDRVQVGTATSGGHPLEWRDGKVISTADSLRIQINVDGEMCWMNAQDELLCPPGTHCAENAAVGPSAA